MENKIKFITDSIYYEDEISYKLYLLYCKITNKSVELFPFVDGLNIIFDTPKEAVTTLNEKGFVLGKWDYIYRDNNDEVCACDYPSECGIIEFDNIISFFLENDCDEVFELLSKLDLHFYFAENKYGKSDDTDLSADFAEWIDLTMGIKKFIKSDWDELLNTFVENRQNNYEKF